MRDKPIPFGKYYLLDRVNTGGMAEVFRAKAYGVEGFERIVAVKRILPSIAADTDFITMFIDEAKIAVQLNHANIAQIFDLGKVGDNYFIALEYVHGKDLRGLFEHARKEREQLPVELACYVMTKICEGLDYAHRKRDASGRALELVHRDVSPQNMLISFEGDVKLIDFGIAKAVGKASRTRTGILKGKFGYLSPEQVRGEEIDQRSDIFGVGIVLYELLTGERLFQGDSDFSTIEKVRSIEIPSPCLHNEAIPSALEHIVLKALSRDRALRYQSALELHDALSGFLDGAAAPFGRKELSAWMRAHFPTDAARDPEQVGNLEGAEALASDATHVPPIVEPTESTAVYKETRDAPEEGKPKPPSTILGMPAVLPPANLATPVPSRKTVPPPPPRPGYASPLTRPPPAPSPGAGRSVPPPPPRTQPPAPPGSAGSPMRASLPAPLSPSTIPAQAARTVPPPPPAVGTLSGPAAGSRGALLNMDWDDEELSTQIYDRPDDEGYDSDDYEADPYEHTSVNREEPVHHYGTPQPQPTYPPPPVQRFPPNQGQSPRSTHMQYGAFGPAPSAQQNYPSFGPAGAPQGVHVSPQAYAQQHEPLPRPAPIGSLRPPAPISQTMTKTMTMSVERPERGRNTLLAVLAVAAVPLLCFVAYVFLARTEPGVVQLTTHPADAVLLFDGKPVGTVSPFVVTGVTPNDKHTIEVQKAGYRSWSQEVQVQAGQTLQFPVTLQPADGSDTQAVGSSAQQATGGFSIETTPSGAIVLLEGQELSGVTPLRVGNLLPRAYEVRLKLAGFREHRARVEVRSGVDQSLPRVVLEPEQVRVRITSEPAGAEAVVVHGDERRALGRTPVDVTVDNDGSRWTVEVSKSGYESYTQPIAIADGAAELSVRAVLTRRAGEPSEAPAALAGSDAPRSSSSSSGGQDTSELDDLGAGRSSAGASGQGTLSINSRPWSQVSIDGKLLGNTPQMNVSLPAGIHRISLVNPEFNLRKNLTVVIKAGQSEKQIVSLQ